MPMIPRFARRPRGARAVAVAALALALAGCFASASRREEADAKAQAAYAQCDELRRNGGYKTHLAAVNCAIPGVVAAYQESAYPFTDLIYVSIQARRIGADRVDTGDVSEAQYQHDVAELDTRLAAEDGRRRDIMRFGGTPQPVPVATLVRGLSAFAPAPTAAALPALPAGADPGCLPLGEIRRCK